MSFMHNYTDMTNDVSTKRKSDIENWSTSDQGIIVLMNAVILVIQYSFFSNISWIQFIERNIIILPAIIGLMLQFNFYFKRAAMKIGVVINAIVKRTTLNNVKTNVVVKTFIAALTMIVDLTVKRTYLFTVAVIKNVVKIPMITFCVYLLLLSMDYMLHLIMSYNSRTVEAVSLSLTILTATFNHIRFVGRFTCLVILFSGIFSNIIFGLLFGVSPFFQLPGVVIINGFLILIFCYSFLHDLHSHEIVYIAVTVSIVIFAHDLALSFIDIPHFVDSLLYGFFFIVSCVYIGNFVFHMVIS